MQPQRCSLLKQQVCVTQTVFSRRYAAAYRIELVHAGAMDLQPGHLVCIKSDEYINRSATVRSQIEQLECCHYHIPLVSAATVATGSSYNGHYWVLIMPKISVRFRGFRPSFQFQ